MKQNNPKRFELKRLTKRHKELLARADMQPAIKHFEKATKASRAWNKLVGESLDKYGDHGSQISGVVRDHFPKNVKDKLRKLARAINTHADAGYYARPKGVRNRTMQSVAGAVATKTGTGFYGPQANPKGKTKMAKKRRTAKQRAATKKLIAFNKKRRGKKKARRKTRRNPRTYSKKAAKKVATFRAKSRAASKKRTSLKKSHLWRVFRCRGKTVMWVYMDSKGKWNWTSDTGKAILFATKHFAGVVAKGIAKKRGYAMYHLGAAPREMSATQIAAQCKKGKA